LGHAAPRLQPGPGAVCRAHPELALEHPALEGTDERLALAREVLRVHEREEILAPARLRRGGVAQEARPAVARVERAGGDVVVPLREIAAVERELQARLGVEELALGAA